MWAAQLGIPYAFADFINPGGSEIAAVYRERFAAGDRRRSAPMTAVAAWVLCADTDEEAQRLATSSRMTLTLLRRGQLIPVPPVEKAIAFLESEGKPLTGSLPGRRGIIGSPATVRAGIDELVAAYRRRRGDRRHDHTRPRGAAALIRARRRGDGPRPGRGRRRGRRDGVSRSAVLTTAFWCIG